MRLWPTTILTPDDWIADIVFADGSKTRVGISAHLSEEKAIEQVRLLLGYRRQSKRIIDIRVRRRVHAFTSISEMHEENRGRLIK